MVKRRAFTDPFIRALKLPGVQRLEDADGKLYTTAPGTPYKLSEHAAKGEGRLVVRVLPSGVKEFFYRYRPGGNDKTLALGRYDQAGRNGKTLAGIRKTLRENRELQRTTGDVKEYIAAETRQRDTAARRGSFEQLLSAYVEDLRDKGSASAAEVAGIFRRHILGGKLPSGKTIPCPFPLLAQTKASAIEAGDIQRILAKMVKAGITRQVNKARSYLHAAFAFGMATDSDPRRAPGEGVQFGIKANPVTSKPIAEFERAGERALSEDELRHYIKALDELPTVQEAALRFNLALACQRPTQLLRAGWPDFDLTGNTLLLKDTKGRGGSRDHLLPLTPIALAILPAMQKLNSEAPGPFSSDGKRPLVVETLSDAVREISKALKKAHKIPAFQQRDLRRTAETMLQRLGVDREVRAHLMSHGRSKGVQGKHYERYDFLDEKRAALEKWADHLARIMDPTTSAKVVPIRAGQVK